MILGNSRQTGIYTHPPPNKKIFKKRERAAAVLGRLPLNTQNIGTEKAPCDRAGLLLCGSLHSREQRIRFTAILRGGSCARAPRDLTLWCWSQGLGLLPPCRPAGLPGPGLRRGRRCGWALAAPQQGLATGLLPWPPVPWFRPSPASSRGLCWCSGLELSEKQGVGERRLLKLALPSSVPQFLLGEKAPRFPFTGNPQIRALTQSPGS